MGLRDVGAVATCGLCGELFVLTLATVDLSLFSGRDAKAALHAKYSQLIPPPLALSLCCLVASH
jgi:hypothetical protein